MEKYFGIAVWALVGSAALCGCNQNHEQKQNAEAEVHDLAAKFLAAKYDITQAKYLAAKYGATHDWEKFLTHKKIVFTIDVQDAFLNKSAPLEFIADPVDIRWDGVHIVADFTVPSAAGFSFLLRLTCTDDQRKVLTDRQANYAIIAKIEKVTKQGDLNITDLEDQTIEANWDTDAYWVTGTCLDLSKLNE